MATIVDSPTNPARRDPTPSAAPWTLKHKRRAVWKPRHPEFSHITGWNLILNLLNLEDCGSKHFTCSHAWPRWPLWPLEWWLTPYKAAQLDWWWEQWCGELSWEPAQRSFSGSWATRSDEPGQLLQTRTPNRNVRGLEGKSGRALTKAPRRARYLAEERRRKFGAGPRTAQRTRTPRRWCRPGSSLIREESRTARSRAEEQKRLRLNNPSARPVTAHFIKRVLIKHQGIKWGKITMFYS